MNEHDRFFTKVKKTKTCWLWTASKDKKGYGFFNIRIKNSSEFKSGYAHRVSYELHREKIPKGMVIDHLCRIRHCVNPKHLEVVTAGENTMRGFGACAINARKTHCKHGHEFTPKNTGKAWPAGRKCRRCDIDKAARWHINHKVTKMECI